MKKLILTFFYLILFSVPSFANVRIEVLKVYDGDSILARIEENIFRIRLIDIDCFEGTLSDRAKWQARKYKMSVDEIVDGGNVAGEILTQMLKDKDVYFAFQGVDKYSRALGTLYVDKVNINKEMLKSPYCKVYNYKKISK